MSDDPLLVLSPPRKHQTAAVDYTQFLTKSSGRWSPRGFRSAIMARRYKPSTRQWKAFLVYFFAALSTLLIVTSLLNQMVVNQVQTHRHQDDVSLPYHQNQDFPPLESSAESSIDHQNLHKDQNHEPRAGPGSKSRKFPGCIIIGARKCGTRALLEFLDLHPQIAIAEDEVHFFDNESNWRRGWEWYRSQMPLTPDSDGGPDQEVLTVEKSPAYFVTGKAPARIYDLNPDIKLVLIVRDPVTRLISDWVQLSSKVDPKSSKPGNGSSTPSTTSSSPSSSFEATVLHSDGLTVNKAYKPVRISIYADFYERWSRLFPAGVQLHVVDGERLIAEPFEELVKLERFLGLPPRIARDQFVYNAKKGFFCIRMTAKPEIYPSRPVQTVKNRTQDGPHPRAPSLHCLNETKGRKHPKVDPKVVQILRKFYAPHNRRFYAQTGQDFGWK